MENKAVVTEPVNESDSDSTVVVVAVEHDQAPEPEEPAVEPAPVVVVAGSENGGADSQALGRIENKIDTLIEMMARTESAAGDAADLALEAVIAATTDDVVAEPVIVESLGEPADEEPDLPPENKGFWRSIFGENSFR